jgi:hypothetical protein
MKIHPVFSADRLHKDLPGPPARLDDWIRKWEAGEDSYEELENSTEMAKSLRASFFKRAGGVM